MNSGLKTNKPSPNIMPFPNAKESFKTNNNVIKDNKVHINKGN